MDGVGELQMAESLAKYEILTCLTKQHDFKAIKKFSSIKKIFPHVVLSTGTSDEDYKRLNEILKEHSFFEFICIDIANGYSDHFSKFVTSVRKKHPTKTIIAGNVVTPEMVEELIINGADIVKIGIGPGSVCTTRTMTGVGVPQFSAILECADAANGVDGHIMADGGCVYPGDIAKAFGGGAHMVMIGGMLAGHNESEQPVVDGKIEFYGMSSDRAREKHGKRKDGYRGNEGRLISLPHRGPVEATLEDILGGVRSACTYIGARRLKDMAKCASFVTTNNVINRVYERYTK